MANGNSLQDLRNLSAELEKKRKSEEIKRQNNLVSEKKNLVHGAVKKKKVLTNNIKSMQQAKWKSLYLENPILISMMLVLATGLIITLICFGNETNRLKPTADPIPRKELIFGSKTYSQVSCYVMDIIKRAVNKKLDELGENTWHRNANPEARYYSILRLNELGGSQLTNVRKIYHYEGYNCYFCICSQDHGNHDLIVKVAMDNNDLKLVAVE